MFVTASDFNILPYRLPSMSTGKAEEFAQFIDSEEELYLKEVLGDNLYSAFIDGLNDLPGEYVSTVATVIGQQYVYGNDVWEAVTAQTGTAPIAGSDWTLIEEDNRWLLLKNGDTYLINGKKYIWAGMIKTLTALIYSRWIEYTASQLTDDGFVIAKKENNVMVDPSTFICRAWNDWSRKVGGSCAQYNTLYGYLYESDDFEDIPDDGSFIGYLSDYFNEQPTKNTFGI